MKFEHFHSRLESILERELELNRPNLQLIGTSSPTALALLLSNNSSKQIDSLPHLVVFPRSADAFRFAQSLSFFDSERQFFVLPHFDVSPYAGLYPKPQLLAERLRFLFQAQSAKPGQIFITSIGALLQKTLPFSALANNSFQLRVDEDIPEDLPLLLQKMGYQSTPMVEDVGQFSQRGGIFDLFSPAHDEPVRIELFGDTVQSLRFFSASTQSSLEQTTPLKKVSVIPARETLWLDENQDSLLERFRDSVGSRTVDRGELEEALRSLSRSTPFEGSDFLLPYFYKNLECAMDHFSSPTTTWLVDPIEISRHADSFLEEMKEEFSTSTSHLIRPPVEELYFTYDNLPWSEEGRRIELSSIDVTTTEDEASGALTIPYRTSNVLDLSNLLTSFSAGSEPWLNTLKNKLTAWEADDYRIFIAIKNKTQSERLRLLVEKSGWSVVAAQESGSWSSWLEDPSPKTVHIINRYLPESVRLNEEKIVFLRDEDLLGKKVRQTDMKASDEFAQRARRLSFGDLNPGDCVVHVQHGIGIYEGLRVMNIGGADSEFIQISYKDKDKLYLPVYRIGQLQKYSGPAATTVLDKLGGSSWEKTKTKVRSHLRDLANELLQLYAKRAELHRPASTVPEESFAAFEAAFPYDETDDQLRAISDIVKDMTSTKPMDRLICGDVGFGKTEVAMRAAFLAASNKKQVAVLAPTTVLTFQHFETFKKRFHGSGFEIRELNRFVSNADAKKTLKELKDGKVDILIGTHRLLSKDVSFSNLGLMIVDEEQKFGVVHKERIKKMRADVDTLTMSATPIPRTLNMSLVGIRDLSLINTAPVDRLPTRTFISKWDGESIRRAVLGEVKRGGQIFFIHNRVQSIYGLADELRTLMPEIRMKIGHGQMDEEELERTLVQFFNHEIDMLLCTTIVESGMDVPKANTMFIDQAHMMGLSQLYQLRGRVGRSKQRAYCYLLLPKGKKIEKEAQERLKVLQENTALGSGIRIAQYDLELRGAGDLLGEEQSGHINSVGYELYMDLLNEAIHTLRGEPLDDNLEPEINLKVPALIPDSYISDIRLRLSFYKALADIRSSEDLDKIDSEFRDQFGEPPEPTQNLMGLMLIRSQCKVLGVRDLSAGFKNISLIFTDKTRLKPETIVQLAMRQNKKYSVTPDNRLNIRMNAITWPAVYEELEQLLKL
jgi:transcription-repair coupling factor (superfamily II helicase)